jgi:hypothetical protein
MNTRKSSVLAIVMAAFMALAPGLASAQVVVSDPATEASTQATFLKTVASYTQQGQILSANNTQILHQVTQIQNQMTQIQAASSTLAYEKQQLSALMQNSGLPVVKLIAQNNTLMQSASKLDPQMTAEFARMVPNYQPNQPYTTYAQTLYNNTAQSEAQALGVGSSAVTSEAQVDTALSQLGNNPSNQLQALQEIIQVGKIQSGQLDKLVKIQSAMMKNMAYEWAAHEKLAQNGGSSQFVGTGDLASAHQLCATRIAGFAQMTATQQAPYLQACLQAASQQAAVGTTTTP